MTRELKPQEALTAHNLCIAQANKSPTHQFIVNGCPACRADVVRLVDAPPLPEIRETDVAELANWVGNQVESCEAEIARTDSNKYVPEDEDDEEGVSARLDLPYFRRILAVLEAVSARKDGGNG